MLKKQQESLPAPQPILYVVLCASVLFACSLQAALTPGSEDPFKTEYGQDVLRRIAALRYTNGGMPLAGDPAACEAMMILCQDEAQQAKIERERWTQWAAKTFMLLMKGYRLDRADTYDWHLDEREYWQEVYGPGMQKNVWLYAFTGLALLDDDMSQEQRRRLRASFIRSLRPVINNPQELQAVVHEQPGIAAALQAMMVKNSVPGLYIDAALQRNNNPLWACHNWYEIVRRALLEKGGVLDGTVRDAAQRLSLFMKMDNGATNELLFPARQELMRLWQENKAWRTLVMQRAHNNHDPVACAHMALSVSPSLMTPEVVELLNVALYYGGESMWNMLARVALQDGYRLLGAHLIAYAIMHDQPLNNCDVDALIEAMLNISEGTPKVTAGNLDQVKLNIDIPGVSLENLFDVVLQAFAAQRNVLSDARGDVDVGLSFGEGDSDKRCELSIAYIGDRLRRCQAKALQVFLPHIIKSPVRTATIMPYIQTMPALDELADTGDIHAQLLRCLRSLYEKDTDILRMYADLGAILEKPKNRTLVIEHACQGSFPLACLLLVEHGKNTITLTKQELKKLVALCCGAAQALQLESIKPQLYEDVLLALRRSGVGKTIEDLAQEHTDWFDGTTLYVLGLMYCESALQYPDAPTQLERAALWFTKALRKGSQEDSWFAAAETLRAKMHAQIFKLGHVRENDGQPKIQEITQALQSSLRLLEAGDDTIIQAAHDLASRVQDWGADQEVMLQLAHALGEKCSIRGRKSGQPLEGVLRAQAITLQMFLYRYLCDTAPIKTLLAEAMQLNPEILAPLDLFCIAYENAVIRQWNKACEYYELAAQRGHRESITRGIELVESLIAQEKVVNEDRSVQQLNAAVRRKKAPHLKTRLPELQGLLGRLNVYKEQFYPASDEALSDTSTGEGDVQPLENYSKEDKKMLTAVQIAMELAKSSDFVRVKKLMDPYLTREDAYLPHLLSIVADMRLGDNDLDTTIQRLTQLIQSAPIENGGFKYPAMWDIMMQEIDTVWDYSDPEYKVAAEMLNEQLKYCGVRDLELGKGLGRVIREVDAQLDAQRAQGSGGVSVTIDTRKPWVKESITVRRKPRDDDGEGSSAHAGDVPPPQEQDARFMTREQMLAMFTGGAAILNGEQEVGKTASSAQDVRKAAGALRVVVNDRGGDALEASVEESDAETSHQSPPSKKKKKKKKK